VIGKTTSVVGAIHELPLQRGSISQEKMLNKSLKQPIFVNSYHDYFVQCVSPKSMKIKFKGGQIAHPQKLKSRAKFEI
jgi:hypothetical protein